MGEQDVMTRKGRVRWSCVGFFFQAEDGIRDLLRSRVLGGVYRRQVCVWGVGCVCVCVCVCVCGCVWMCVDVWMWVLHRESKNMFEKDS